MAHVSEADPTGFENYDLVIIGAPTQSAGPSPKTKNLLQNIDRSIIRGKPIAAFDTRLTESAFDKKWLSKLVFAMGFAAPKIARDLRKKGARVIGTPGDFYVTGSEGPLKDGEIERAAAWAKNVIRLIEK
jgi:flavodoxin